MLHKETVEKRTFELLVKLMQDEYMADFILVGGTALALQLGHRKSVDIDLFTQNEFDVSELRNHLVERYDFEPLYTSRWTLKGTIEGVFIDCMRHKYPLVKSIIVEEEVRFASVADIAAMKLNAIVDNGSRMKDFVDVAKISESMPLDDIIGSYEVKYNDNNKMIAKKALVYFNDVIEEPIVVLDRSLSWESVKKRLEEVVRLSF